MDANDIIALARAGYTAEQIGAIAKASDAPAPTQESPAPQPAEQPAPTPTPQPAAQPERPEVNDALKSLTEQIAQIAKVTADLQKAAIGQTAQPKVETADDIIASIINP